VAYFTGTQKVTPLYDNMTNASILAVVILSSLSLYLLYITIILSSLVLLTAHSQFSIHN
jgi:hypothetical protein